MTVPSALRSSLALFVAYTLISCSVVIAVFSTLAVRKYRATS